MKNKIAWVDISSIHWLLGNYIYNYVIYYFWIRLMARVEL
jgi:hypothetical protein